MAEPLEVSLDELRLGWVRMKRDRPNRSFATHPYLLDWIEVDLETWLESLRERLVTGYVPRPSRLALIPKPGFLLRPAAILEVEDEVVYNVVLGRLFGGIYRTLAPFQPEPDVAYPLAAEENAVEWVHSGFRIWRHWREGSLRSLEGDTSYVVVTDITGFYDNIDLPRLLNDLRELGATTAELSILSECLKRWAHPRGKGIPQGYSASDILARVYFNPVDSALRHGGYRHLRYVDDLRVFCRSRREAQQTLIELFRLTHTRGLSLQSAKTEILSVEDARARFDGVNPVIRSVHKQLQTELRVAANIERASIPPAEVMRLLETLEGEAPEVLERTFRERFLSPDQRFDKTLFHYLLARLGKTGSRVAVDFCLEVLRSRPDETAYVLRYFGQASLEQDQIDNLVVFATSDEMIYDYQLFEVVRWFFASETFDMHLRNHCFAIAFDLNRDPWLRSYALAYVGRYSFVSHYDRIEAEYPRAGTDIEKADLVAAMWSADTARRNAFYARVQGDADLVQRAVRLAKTTRLHGPHV